MKHFSTRMRLFLLILGLLMSSTPAHSQSLPDLLVPPSSKIEPWADHVSGAREMTLGNQGTLFVGGPEAGKVYALRNSHGAGRPGRLSILAEGLNVPTGVFFHQGDFDVAEVDRI